MSECHTCKVESDYDHILCHDCGLEYCNKCFLTRCHTDFCQSIGNEPYHLWNEGCPHKGNKDGTQSS